MVVIAILKATLNGKILIYLKHYTNLKRFFPGVAANVLGQVEGLLEALVAVSAEHLDIIYNINETITY